MTISQLKKLRETENKVEFKKAKTQYNYNNGRKCLLAYIVALANEGGGIIVLGMNDQYPHQVVGSTYYEGLEGQLEQNIFRDLKIRVRTETLKEGVNRVLVIHIPSRPIGMPLYFNDIPLMRVGDGTERMSEEMYRKIINESEPDYSASFCEGLTLSDLSIEAINILKNKYSKKQNNSSILYQNELSFLQDLELINNNKITYAALVLLGTKESIKKYLPQYNIIVEYRNSEDSIEHDNKEEFQNAYFISIDKIWQLINSRNSTYHLSEGAYIFDILYFHEEVIRESIHNAVAHRDYHFTSEIVIKQFPKKLIVSSPGGFPLGVNTNNLISVNSTPRNRLLTEVMLKSGLVERSGQGVDKMFLRCLEVGKAAPDYSTTDNYQVVVELSGIIQDEDFALSLRNLKDEKNEERKLNLNDLMTIHEIKNNLPKKELNVISINKLLQLELIVSVGKTKGQYYRLSDKFLNTSELNIENSIMLIIKQKREAKLDDFLKDLGNKFTREQIKYGVKKLIKNNKVIPTGKGSGTKYKLS